MEKLATESCRLMRGAEEHFIEYLFERVPKPQGE